MTEELKPCPFCGSEKVDCFWDDPYDGYHGDCGRYRTICNNCYAEIVRKEKQSAIEAWNRRESDEQIH
nr:MAG TPA: restriction alleviation protein [Caudoviricetes sp.]